jgi:HEXXH motif-containing protein
MHVFRELFLNILRPSVMAAQTILHETGHNLMSTFIELAPLCANAGVKVMSPIVPKGRAVSAVFHGAYSLACEIYFTWILIKAGIPPVEGANMERYLDERTQVVTEARDVLIGCAELAPIGAQVIEEISAILDEIRPHRVVKATFIS